MIVLGCIALGLLLRAGSAKSIAEVGALRLRGEGALLLLLFVQAVVPMLPLSGFEAHVAYSVWVAAFPLMIVIALRNRRQPGMAVLATGLALNMLVIAANAGMPVLSDAFTATGAVGVMRIPVGDFVHVMGSSATRLVWLSDVLPLPGPPWMRAVPSPGDCLLYVGVVAFLGGASSVAGHKTEVGR